MKKKPLTLKDAFKECINNSELMKDLGYTKFNVYTFKNRNISDKRMRELVIQAGYTVDTPVTEETFKAPLNEKGK